MSQDKKKVHPLTPNKFRQRFVIPFLVIIAFVACILTWMTIRQQNHLLEEELRRKGIDIANTISKRSVVGLLLEDKESLLELANKTQQNDIDISGVAIFNSKGETIATTDIKLSLPISVSDFSSSRQDHVFSAKTHNLFVAEIEDRNGFIIGFALIKVSREKIVTALTLAASKMIMTIFGVFVIVFFIAYYLLRKISFIAKDLQKSRDEIAASKNFIDNIIKNLVDPLIVVNPNGSIKSVNEATIKLLHYDENDLVGEKNSSDFCREKFI